MAARVLLLAIGLQLLLRCSAQTAWAPIQLNVAQFKWIGSNVAMVLSRQAFPQVWLSGNGGLNWTNIATQLPGYSNTTYASNIHENPANPNYVYIQGQSATSWVSTDAGTTWQAITPTLNYATYNTILMEWHPLQASQVLACVNTPSNGPYPLMTAYYSSDFGTTFSQVATNVFQCGWGDAGLGTVPMSRIYLIQGTDPTNFVFVHTDDFGKTFVTDQSLCFQFVFMPNHLILGVYVPQDDEIVLRITTDLNTTSRTFYEASFPWGDELDNNGYSILDDSTGALFVGVNHGHMVNSHWGNIYHSDSLAFRFSFNFPYVAIEWPFFDFEHLHSLDGVYLANMVTKPTNTNPNPTNDEIVSYMSFNNGAYWLLSLVLSIAQQSLSPAARIA
eukprot:TRINITY_DN4934_c0_g1_i2.p1 TRINITY_DN4934_c0_g1~~TRINITY_DN4934_c0_g1_i2.p1  ORF type:complete len:389 (+),score=115.49 TRINITY_DN4934_c0_g1_i2:128-1294(+)